MYQGHIPCAHCGSLETEAGFDEVTCLRCGHQTRLQIQDGPRNEPLLGRPVSLRVQYHAKNLG